MVTRERKEEIARFLYNSAKDVVRMYEYSKPEDIDVFISQAVTKFITTADMVR